MTDAVDYIVVGAGPGGCAVAARLAGAKPGLTIALLEAGPDRTPLLSQVPLGMAALVPFRSRWNYGYSTVPQAGLGGRKGYQPRGRGLGGSSLINAMIYIRGQPQDYDDWAALGCDGWGWSDLLSYFRRAEDNARGADAFHGSGGPLRVEDVRDRNPATDLLLLAAEQAGFSRNLDFNGAVQEGIGRYQLFQKAGRRVDAASAYLGEAGARPRNLRVIANAQVDRLNIDGRRAQGVSYRQGNKEHRLDARCEIVLAAGAFGTPQLLMVSGIGPATNLRSHGIEVISDRPEVGRNLQDHINYTIKVRARSDGLIGFGVPVVLRMPAAIHAWRTKGRGMLTTNVGESGGFVKSSAALDRPDLQLHFCVGIVDDHNRKPHFATGYSLQACALHPHSRGTVTLSGPDIRTAPRIDPNFLSDPRDMETLMAGAKISRRIMAAPALAMLNGKPLHGAGANDDDALAALIRAEADTQYHPAGTCRMGGDPGSVVDPRLRVRSIERLRIADASIMPRLISGNTQAPTAMIGEKASDLILSSATS